MAKKKSQPQSALPFFLMAIFALLAGFPVWLVAVLALIGMLVLKLEKDKKALNKLPPLPAAETDLEKNTSTSNASSAAGSLAGSLSDLLSGPFGRELPTANAPAPAKYPSVPEPLTYEEPVDVPELPPWASANYDPYPSTPSPVTNPPSSRFQTSAALSPISTNGLKARGPHPIVKHLRSRNGARQAIIAMTVLGQPRAIQPYELDPIQQSDIAPGRPS